MPAVKVARRSLLTRIGGIAAAVALGIGGAVGIATPASAALSDCQDGRTCVWKDTGYSTGGFGNIQYSFVNGIAKFSNYYWGIGQWGSLDKNVSSVYNNGNQQRSYLKYGTGFSGTTAANLGIKQGISNLGTHSDKSSSGGFEWCVNNPTSYLCT